MQLFSVNHAHHSIKTRCTSCNRPPARPQISPVYSSAFQFQDRIIFPRENQNTTETSYWQLQFSFKKKIAVHEVIFFSKLLMQGIGLLLLCSPLAMAGLLPPGCHTTSDVKPFPGNLGIEP